MRIKNKQFRSCMDLLLPLAALVTGILIMVISKPVAAQSVLPVPLPQSFLGEYSYDQQNWYPIEQTGELSALDGDLYLRGHFERAVAEESRLYFFSNHIGIKLTVNGQLCSQDILFEIERYGIKLQPSMCSSGWKYYFFPEELPADSLIEIHLKNPHEFGNKSAYQDFLSTLCITPDSSDFMAENLAQVSDFPVIIGTVLGIVGILLFGSALLMAFLRMPNWISAIRFGLLAVFAAGCFFLDSIDLSFRIENHILTTYGWQICVMYSIHLLAIMAREPMEQKRRKAANVAVAVSAAGNIILILLSFTGMMLMYDTLSYWVMLQWICCPVLAFCCAAELIFGKKGGKIPTALYLLIFLCVPLDSLGVMDSIYSRGTLTKIAVLLFFLCSFLQLSRKLLFDYTASARAQKLEKELEESRIAVMLSQIQPHFIFNVLGTIRGLCREDPQQAWSGLGDFSNYLRGNMNALTSTKSIPFEMELQHIEAYLRLEQMRLGEKLTVEYDIQAKDFSIPPLMLQPLVENAVKHGIFYKAEGGTVIIRSRREASRIILSVEDNGVGFEAAALKMDFDRRQHIGLANVRYRAEKMLGGTLHVDSNRSSGSKVTLEFPAEDHC